MKPFDFQLALQGCSVVTRDGKKVVAITPFHDLSRFLVEVENGIFVYTNSNGEFHPTAESAFDIFMDDPREAYPSPAKETPYAVRALQEAAMIMEERGKQYDSEGGERSMAACVTMFNAAAKRDLTESEGWLLMECLKLVRLFQRTGFHEDSAVDSISYAALLAESKSKEK